MDFSIVAIAIVSLLSSWGELTFIVFWVVSGNEMCFKSIPLSNQQNFDSRNRVILWS